MNNFVTTRPAPSPAPVPWQVTTYTEENYKILTKVGQEFAIGIQSGKPGFHGSVSYDGNKISNVLSFVDRQVVSYGAEAPVGYGQITGTEWVR